MGRQRRRGDGRRDVRAAVQLMFIVVHLARCRTRQVPPHMRNLTPEQREEMMSQRINHKLARRCLCNVQPCLVHAPMSGPLEAHQSEKLDMVRDVLARMRADRLAREVAARRADTARRLCARAQADSWCDVGTPSHRVVCVVFVRRTSAWCVG